MNVHVEAGHLTKFEAFRLKRDHVLDFETFFYDFFDIISASSK